MAEILSIEDDIITSRLIQKMLEKAGHNMHHASDGTVALNMLESQLRPELILLDVNIPGLDGYQVCRKIRSVSQFKKVPIVFLTSNTTEEDRKKAFEMGASDFLIKPLQSKSFLNMINTHLQKANNEPEQELVNEDVSVSSEVGLSQSSETSPSSLESPNENPEPVSTKLVSSEPVGEWTPEKGQALALARTIEKRKSSSLKAFDSQEEDVVEFADEINAVLSKNTTTKSISTVGSKTKPKADTLSMVPDFTRFVAFLVGVTQKKDEVSLTEIFPSTLYDFSAVLEISSYEMAKFVSGFTKIKYLAEIDHSAIELGILSERFCKKHHIIPIQFENELTFVISQPFDIELQDALRRFKNAQILISEPENIHKAFEPGVSLKKEAPPASETDLSGVLGELSDIYQAPDDLDEELEAINENTGENDAPMIRLVNGLIENAYLMDASDIHIEPQENQVVVRYRIDGELKIINELRPLSLINPIVARIKIMAQMDIAERRLPQDGRIGFKEFSRKKQDFDLRVATAPMKYGEKVVMRIIDKQKSTLPLESLGFSKHNLYLYRKHVHTPYGMILHVGPTGSGKSMTLYSALGEIYRPELNIQTAEDPIEYSLPGINQLQVKPDIGLTFKRALRSYLRQDPDVILIGEIRDLETAHISMEAAMTGHLLLSTLHTNDAASTMMRLLEMGVEPFLISSSLVMVCAQRLLRRLCRHCKESYLPDEEEQYLLGLKNKVRLYRALGCKECNHLGYKGRIGVHEILIPNDIIRREMTQNNITSEALKKIAVESCEMTTLYWDGMDKVIQGITSVDEVLTRIRPDTFDSRPSWMKSE